MPVQGELVFYTQPRPPPWSSGQSSWLQIQRSQDSPRCQIFGEAVCLERGSLSLMNTTEEQPGRNSSGPCLKSRECGRGDPLSLPSNTLYPQKLALTSPTSGGRSVGIVLSRTEATMSFRYTAYICSSYEYSTIRQKFKLRRQRFRNFSANSGYVQNWKLTKTTIFKYLEF
jgi:hypothetical protein